MSHVTECCTWHLWQEEWPELSACDLETIFEISRDEITTVPAMAGPPAPTPLAAGQAPAVPPYGFIAPPAPPIAPLLRPTPLALGQVPAVPPYGFVAPPMPPIVAAKETSQPIVPEVRTSTHSSRTHVGTLSPSTT